MTKTFDFYPLTEQIKSWSYLTYCRVGPISPLATGLIRSKAYQKEQQMVHFPLCWRVIKWVVHPFPRLKGGLYRSRLRSILDRVRSLAFNCDWQKWKRRKRRQKGGAAPQRVFRGWLKCMRGRMPITSPNPGRPWNAFSIPLSEQIINRWHFL